MIWYIFSIRGALIWKLEADADHVILKDSNLTVSVSQIELNTQHLSKRESAFQDLVLLQS